ncbi:MAG: (2Fe-2S) ferredoxin domain-containing protein [Eubacteriales bacterium]
MKSLAELQAIRDKMKSAMNIREEGGEGYRVVVGMATCGIAAGARPVLTALLDEIAKRNIQDVIVTQTGCIGICQYEPVVEVIAGDGNKTTYVNMTAEKVGRVVADHLVNGNVVSAFTIGNAK